MRKARPVVASGVGGIKDQITHKVHGLLLDDSTFGGLVETLLEDREAAQRMGQEAHRRVLEEYLAPRRLTQELELAERVGP